MSQQIYFLLLLFLYGGLVSVASWSFESHFEALVLSPKYGVNCMGDCIENHGKKTCVYDWEAHETECKNLSIPTKKYRTLGNKVCVSDCGMFNDKEYQWCAIGEHSDWDYCNRLIAKTARISYKTANKYVTCSDECTTRGESYNWCHTVVDSWHRCDPAQEVLVFNYPTEDIKTNCKTPCKLYKEDNLPHCYDASGNWKKCYLNPAYEHVLDEIDRRFTEYCKPHEGRWAHNHPRKRETNDMGFDCPVDVGEVATRHEDNNVRVPVRHWDPTNPITNDRNPVISYTVFDTYSYFGDAEVRLPLVLRAVITTHTVGQARDVFTSIVNRNYNHMDRYINLENYDERGHILASRLGGPMQIFNIFPQSWIHNRGGGSTWYFFEGLLDEFVRGHNNRYVDYTAVLSYRTDENHILQHRPTAIALRVRLYIDGELTNILGHRLASYADNVYENLYFSNDPDH